MGWKAGCLEVWRLAILYITFRIPVCKAQTAVVRRSMSSKSLGLVSPDPFAQGMDTRELDARRAPKRQSEST